MVIPYDLVEDNALIYTLPVVATPATATEVHQWVPTFNGEIVGGWASEGTLPASGTSTVVVEIGTTDAITWTFTSGDTAGKTKAGTLSTTHTECIFDTDDVLNLDVTRSSGTEERLLNVSLLIKGR